MQFFILIVSSLLFVNSVLGQTRAPVLRSLHQYVRQCRTNIERCEQLRCASESQNGVFPFSSAYGCCSGKVIDESKHVCTGSGILECNPCTQFRCGDGRCTLAVWKCDAFKDCPDGLDEVGCGSCTQDQFQCKNRRQCINKDGICNKVNDCDDGSDEFKCHSPIGSCGTNRYRCGNNRCIAGQLFCNGNNDCGDNSDEQGPGCRRSVSRPRDTIPEEAIEEDYNNGKPPRDADTDVISNV